jgi:hypothetical protein
LTLHGDGRDIEIELIRHDTAARLVRWHTGQVAASEVFFRGDGVCEKSFDGEGGVFSINFSKVVCVQWEPYPERDGELDGDQGLSESEWRVVLKLVDDARRRAASDTRNDPAGDEPAQPGESAAGDPVAPSGPVSPPPAPSGSGSR